MSDKTYLDWPFLEDHHRKLAVELDIWSAEHVAKNHGPDADAECRMFASLLGNAGGYRTPWGEPMEGRRIPSIRARSAFCGRRCWRAARDLPISLLPCKALVPEPSRRAGSEEQKRDYLPRVAAGTAIAAFALSEPGSGSDVAAMSCSASEVDDAYILDGEKTDSNGGIADFYVVFARTGEAPGARGITAFVIHADTPGLEIAERIPVIAPHPCRPGSYSRTAVSPKAGC